ncbi:fumarylacetoacetate hydrolase family protein [Rhodoferax sp.]|uniref:fumarylacetoacetate hydrolase family protein n=1 Tax=Rhodoferax sp. TaxID=50421 RepID=UPI00374DDB39
MKLATYQDGSRDGQLVVVSRDLATAHYATGIASRLQQVLDDWGFLSPQLQDLFDALNQGRGRHTFAFDARQCMAPLPRAYQWVEAQAYPSLLQPRDDVGPVLAPGSGDNFLGACDLLRCQSEALAIDFNAGLAAITADVPQGVTPAQALDGVRLLMLSNSTRLRSLEDAERAKGAGWVQSAPATAFSPVAATLDELVFQGQGQGESAWEKGRIHLPLHTSWNGRKVGMCDAGPEMQLHFGQLIAHLCATRHLRAGSIVGSGPVSNAGTGSKSKAQWPKGYNSIAEKRAMETLLSGQPSTGYLQFGDTVRIEMKGRDGSSLFGAIDQEVAPLAAAAR